MSSDLVPRRPPSPTAAPPALPASHGTGRVRTVRDERYGTREAIELGTRETIPIVQLRSAHKSSLPPSPSMRAHTLTQQQQRRSSRRTRAAAVLKPPHTSSGGAQAAAHEQRRCSRHERHSAYCRRRQWGGGEERSPCSLLLAPCSLLRGSGSSTSASRSPARLRVHVTCKDAYRQSRWATSLIIY